MTEEELAFYRKRSLEVHEEIARERLAREDMKLATAMKAAKMLRGGSVKRPRSR